MMKTKITIIPEIPEALRELSNAIYARIPLKEETKWKSDFMKAILLATKRGRDLNEVWPILASFILLDMLMPRIKNDDDECKNIILRIVAAYIYRYPNSQLIQLVMVYRDSLLVEIDNARVLSDALQIARIGYDTRQMTHLLNYICEHQKDASSITKKVSRKLIKILKGK